MTTWTEIFPDVDGPPVVGDPTEFDGVAGDFTKMHDAAQTIVDQFSWITADGGITEIQGEVFDAFLTFVRDVSDRLQSLPAVTSDAAAVFTTHASKLRDYRDAADKALASAAAKWTSQKSKSAAHAGATSDAEQLKSKLDGMAPDDPNRVQTQQQYDQANGSASKLDGELSSLAGELKQFRGQWDTLNEDEAELRKRTDEALDDIDLHSLSDPGFFGSIVEGAFALVKWVYNVTGLHDLVDALVALAHGDWANFLWRFRDFLDKALLIVGVVALFVCPALAIVLLIGASIKLAIDVGLYASGSADPKTGRTISLTDIAFDVADVALGAIGVKAASAAKAAGKPVLTTAQKTRALVGDANTFAKGTTAAVLETVLTKYGMPLVARHSATGPYRIGITKFVFRSTANTYAVFNTGRSAVNQATGAGSEVTDRPTVGVFDAMAHPSRSTRPIIGPIDPFKVAKTGGKVLTTVWK